jgi:hypothetical protein
MRTKKILESSINIDDPSDIFSNDQNAMIIQKLSDKYVNRCFSSCLVVNINKIIRRSYIYMKETLDGGAYMNVLFEADVIIYQKNEIISGCQIMKKETNGIIHLKSEYAGIQLNIRSNMSIYKEKDIVPVIVKMVRYNPNQNAISVSAFPFIPLEPNVVYYNIVGELTDLQKAELDVIAAQIKEKLTSFEKMTTSDKKIYKFFIELLNNDKHNIKSSALKIKLQDLPKVTSGVIVYPAYPYDVNTVNHIKAGHKDAVDESPYIIFATMLNQYLSRLQTMSNFLREYPTFTEVQKHKDIWRMYATQK